MYWELLSICTIWYFLYFNYGKYMYFIFTSLYELTVTIVWLSLDVYNDELFLTICMYSVLVT